MKIIPLLIGACLVLVVTGCQKPSNVIGRAETTIKGTALAAIAAKYPDVSSSELRFHNIMIWRMSDGKEAINVTYDLPASAKTITEGKKATTTTKAIGVRMSPSGTVETVSKSTEQDIYNVAQ